MWWRVGMYPSFAPQRPGHWRCWLFTPGWWFGAQGTNYLQGHCETWVMCYDWGIDFLGWIQLCTFRIGLFQKEIGVSCLSLYHFLLHYSYFSWLVFLFRTWASDSKTKLFSSPFASDLQWPFRATFSYDAGPAPRCASLYQPIFVPRQSWLRRKLKVYPDETAMTYVCLHIRYMVVSFQRYGVITVISLRVSAKRNSTERDLLPSLIDTRVMHEQWCLACVCVNLPRTNSCTIESLPYKRKSAVGVIE